jgi:hypothetical protein
MNTDELLKALTENGCRVCVSPSEFGGGFDLQINTNEGIVYLDPHCESVTPGLLDVWSQIQTGRRLVPMAGSGPIKEE